MKRNSSFIKISLAILIICTSISCHRNKLKTDEKKLTSQIKTEEEQKAYENKQREEREQALADSLAKLPKGFQFKEERQVDPNHPPMIIDIAGSLENIKEYKLSNVASSVKYIRMEQLQDSSIKNNIKYNYYLTNNYLIAANLYGIYQFSKSGQLVKTIVKNETTGVTFNEKEDEVWLYWSNFSKIGGEPNIWGHDDYIFYQYMNTTTGQRYIMEYDCSGNTTNLNDLSFDSEHPLKIRGEGKISVDLNFGQQPHPDKAQGGGMMSPSFSFCCDDLLFTPDRNTIVIPTYRKKGTMLEITNSKTGNILTSFTKKEHIENYTKQVARFTDMGTKYKKNGNLYYRTNFNDTIFQIIPPNRLLPVYVFNLGSYKLTMSEGKDPSFNLKGKIIPKSFADTKDYIFLTFCKDNYDCPNNRKNKKVKFYHAIFNKMTYHLDIVAGDSTDYDAPILLNDIDGGLPVWPNNIMIGRDGEIMISLFGKELKKHVESDLFINSEAPKTQKEKLKLLAEQVTDYEQILMIVK